MTIKVKSVWLEDANDEKVVPVTTDKQVLTKDGESTLEIDMRELDSRKRDKREKLTKDDFDISANEKKLGLNNLQDEVIQAITGNAPVNNVIADGAVVTEKIADGSVTLRKRTVLGDPAYISGFNSQGNWKTIFDFNSKQIVIPRDTNIVYRNVKYATPYEEILDFHPSGVFFAVYFNTVTEKFSTKGTEDLKDLSEDEILIAIVNTRYKNVVCNGVYDIIGGLKEGRSIYVGDPAYYICFKGDYVDFNFSERKIKIPSDTSIVYGGNLKYTVPTDIEVNMKPGVNFMALFFDTEDKSFTVKDGDMDVNEKNVLLAIFSYDMRKVISNGTYSVNGKAVESYDIEKITDNSIFQATSLAVLYPEQKIPVDFDLTTKEINFHSGFRILTKKGSAVVKPKPGEEELKIKIQYDSDQGTNSIAVYYDDSTGEIVQEAGWKVKNDFDKYKDYYLICIASATSSRQGYIFQINCNYTINGFDPFLDMNPVSRNFVRNDTGREWICTFNIPGQDSDFTFVGDELWVFYPNPTYDHTTWSHLRIFDLDFEAGQAENIHTLRHNWGHCNSIDYNPQCDAFIFANGVDARDNTLQDKIFLIQNKTDVIRNKPNLEQIDVYEYSDFIINLDELGFDFGQKVNVCWGESNRGQYNIIYVVSNVSDISGGTDKNGTKYIRKILLGQGEFQLENGNFIPGKGEKEFNGTFKILNVYTNPGYEYYETNQGLDFYNGILYEGNGHDGIWHSEYQLNTDGSIIRTQMQERVYTRSGEEISGYTEGIAIKDGKLFIGFYQRENDDNDVGQKIYVYKL